MPGGPRLGHSLGMLTDATPEARKFAESFDYSLLASSRAQRLGWLARFMPDRRLTESISYIRACVDKHVLNAKKAEIRTKQQQQGESTDKSSPTPTTRAKAAAGSSSRGGYGFLDELIGSGAPDEYVRDQVLSIMPAGRDTTASALVSLFYELSRRPDVVGKIREEIASLGEPNPDWAQLKGMKYLANVIKERRLSLPILVCLSSAARFSSCGAPEGSPRYRSTLKSLAASMHPGFHQGQLAALPY